MKDVPLAPKLVLLAIAAGGLVAIGMQPVQTINEPIGSYTKEPAAYTSLSSDDQARVVDLQNQIEALLSQIKSLSQPHSMPVLDVSAGDQPPITSSNGSIVIAESYLVAPGGTIHFTGKGFAANERITIMSAGTALDTIRADQNGDFNITKVAPTVPNSPIYWFTGETSRSHDSVMITVSNAQDLND